MGKPRPQTRAQINCRCRIGSPSGPLAERRKNFSSRAHQLAWIGDFAEISSRLSREGLIDQLWQHIAEGKARSQAILNGEHAAALRVFDWLVEHNSMDGETFAGLMRGDNSAR
jgi:hypothetical protein